MIAFCSICDVFLPNNFCHHEGRKITTDDLRGKLFKQVMLTNKGDIVSVIELSPQERIENALKQIESPRYFIPVKEEGQVELRFPLTPNPNQDKLIAALREAIDCLSVSATHGSEVTGEKDNAEDYLIVIADIVEGKK